MLTPMQIQNHEFKKGFRGYSEDDVDEFMKQIADDYQILFRDNREMKETIEQLREQLEHYKQMEATMNSTLMLAQETAENVKVAARKEAEVIIREAEQQKQAMIHETAQYIRDGQERYEIIRNDVAVFRAKMESLLKSQMELLDRIVLPECRDGKCEGEMKVVPAVMNHGDEDVAVESVVEESVETEA